MNIYRKIYEMNYGPIPKDKHGRTYEIHHIDGDHNNNNISNLKCVSIEEHYAIHYAQGDWAACLLISDRMNVSPLEKSKLAKEQFKNGLNPFIDFLSQKQLSERSSKANRTRVNNKTHNFLGDKNPSHDRVKNGTHNWQDREKARERQLIKILDGSHNLPGKNHHQHDCTIYEFIHVDTKQIVKMTRNELIKKYNVSSQNLYHVIKGNRKRANGWSLNS
jgi:hypothetical protein